MHRTVGVAHGEAGRSASAVPAPTTIACDSARRRWASARDAAPVIHCDEPSAAAMRPSRLMAVLTTVKARPRRRCTRYGASDRDAASAPVPTSTVTPRSRSWATPRPATCGSGSSSATTTRVTPASASATDAGSGAAVVRAGFEGGVDGRAAGPVPGLAQRLDLGVRTAGRLGGTLADDLAVPHDDRADPRVGRGPPAGGLAPGERPVHEFGVGGHLWCCSVSPGHLGCERAGGVAATSARPRPLMSRRRGRSWSCALSHPDSHRRPRLLTGSTTRLAVVGSRAPR